MYEHDIRGSISLLEAFQHYTEDKDYTARPTSRRTQRIGYGRGVHASYCDHEMTYVDRLQEELEKLRYVDEVCFDHMAWVQVNFETANFKVAQRRMFALKEKID